jgi:hypothetical protein
VHRSRRSAVLFTNLWYYSNFSSFLGYGEIAELKALLKDRVDIVPSLSLAGLKKPYSNLISARQGARHPNSASLNFFYRDVCVPWQCARR